MREAKLVADTMRRRPRSCGNSVRENWLASRTTMYAIRKLLP